MDSRTGLTSDGKGSKATYCKKRQVVESYVHLYPVRNHTQDHIVYTNKYNKYNVICKLS